MRILLGYFVLLYRSLRVEPGVVCGHERSQLPSSCLELATEYTLTVTLYLLLLLSLLS